MEKGNPPTLLVGKVNGTATTLQKQSGDSSEN